MKTSVVLTIVTFSTLSALAWTSKRFIGHGQASRSCPAGLTCALTYQEAQDLKRAAEDMAFNEFAAQCNGQGLKVEALHPVSQTKCSQNGVHATCDSSIEAECNLVDPYPNM